MVYFPKSKQILLLYKSANTLYMNNSPTALISFMMFKAESLYFRNNSIKKNPLIHFNEIVTENPYKNYIVYDIGFISKDDFFHLCNKISSKTIWKVHTFNIDRKKSDSINTI